MTRINGADAVLALVQEQLHRLGKDRAQARSPNAKAGATTPLDRLRALAGRDGLSDDDVKRALVRGLLVQQLGESVGNDPAFEHVAGDVLRILGDSDDGRALLDRALQELTTR